MYPSPRNCSETCASSSTSTFNLLISFSTQSAMNSSMLLYPADSAARLARSTRLSSSFTLATGTSSGTGRDDGVRRIASGSDNISAHHGRGSFESELGQDRRREVDQRR